MSSSSRMRTAKPAEPVPVNLIVHDEGADEGPPTPTPFKLPKWESRRVPKLSKPQEKLRAGNHHAKTIPPQRRAEEPPRDTPFLTRVVDRLKSDPDPLIALAIALAYVVWLTITTRDLGFARDEGFYFSAAGDYERWFRMLLDTPGKAVERGAIDASWASNHEHPSLMKGLFALSHMFLYEKWHLFQHPSTAWRFPGICMMGVALWVTYMFAARRFSRGAGVVATLALGLMPNVFYNAHLACFDVPIMAMWTACIYVYWRAETEPTFWRVILCGVVYGLTLDTKHNAWMLPAVFGVHAMVAHGRAISRTASRSSKIPIPASLVSMATLGPAVFFLLWPWIWPIAKVKDGWETNIPLTMARIQEYVNFHVNHEYYNIEFLGRTYFGPPSPKLYMPLMILATVPTVTLVLFAVGAIDRLKVLALRVVGGVFDAIGRDAPAVVKALPADRLQIDLLIFLALAVPLGPFLLPRTPIFGGTKHWIPAYPFLAMLAGYGFDIVWRKIEALLAKRALDTRKKNLVLAGTVAAAFSGPLAITVHSHPFGLSTYVPLVGGTQGGADLGLNRQFWGFTTQSLGPWFEKNTKPGETVYFMDTAWPSWVRLVDEKRIPPWLRGVGSPAEATVSIVHHEQHMNEVDYNIWTEYKTSTPVYVLTHDGVPIITVYRRAGAK